MPTSSTISFVWWPAFFDAMIWAMVFCDKVLFIPIIGPGDTQKKEKLQAEMGGGNTVPVTTEPHTATRVTLRGVFRVVLEI